MLVLSRKINEVITIGSDITITVVEIRGDKVRLGINAPKECPVWRAELTADKQFTQGTHWIVQLSTFRWLEILEADGWKICADRRGAHKFSSKDEAEKALAEEREIAPWLQAAVHCVHG
jgi:carbon storage regulator CsrA